ncbi:MAG: PH domain-containing protein [Candidatus Taylorbacteria bacterium]|nr:PH domain-containing protein [Candidatus Taylorbacteria bacterium]
MLTLEDGEKILYIARKHWFLFFGQTIFLFFFAVVPLALLLIPVSAFNEAFSALHVVNYGVPLFTFFWSLWLLLLWLMLALLWTNYYLDIWVLTNHRVVDIEQIGLFNRKVSFFRFDQIQDTTVKVSGLVETLIGFGTVEIHTASNESFVFKGVAHPNVLKDMIMSEHHRVHTE